MLQNKTDLKIILFIIIVGGLFFIPFLGGVHLFDWDEINFAECAREMIVTGDYMRVYIDYQPFWEKPPLFFWTQAASMHIFGINEFAARFPNAIIGIISLILLYLFGKKEVNQRFGIIWALTYAGSLLPHFYFRSGIIDPMFNLFMFLGVYYLYRFYSVSDESYTPLRWAGFFVGLAILVKGPVGYLLPTISIFVYWAFRRKVVKVTIKEFLIYTAMSTIVSLLWFGLEVAMNGTWFLEQFITYQIRLLTTGDAGHSGPIYYHIVVLLIGCFPASLIMFKSFKNIESEQPFRKDMRLWMFILLGVVIIIFSIVKTKIVHYSSLAYFPITFLAAYGLNRILEAKAFWKFRNTLAVIGIAILFAVLLSAIPLIGMYTADILPYVKERFVRGNLEANVNWTGYELFIGGGYFIAIFVGAVLLSIRKYIAGAATLYVSTMIMIFTLLPIMLPKIESYTQRTPIEFFQSLQGKDCYVKAMGYRTYADLFYSRKPYETSAAALDVPIEQWDEFLLNGEIDKPVYIVTKIQDAHRWLYHPNLHVIDQKNGWTFFKREVK